MKVTKFTACAAALLAAAVVITALGGCGKDKNTDATTVGEITESEPETTETAGVTDVQTSVPESEQSAETQTAAASETAAASQNAEKTTSVKESTTVQEQNTAAGSNTSGADKNSATPAKTEFDIIVSDVFYITGKTIDEAGTVAPLEIAKTADSLYMLSDFDGTEMGALINGDTAYMICPDKKAYLEITASLRKTMGIDDSEMFDTASCSFSDLVSLANAEKTEQNVGFQGATCTAYSFTREKSRSVFYMNGSKLVGFLTENLDGTEPVITVVSSITADVPADRKAPSSEYKGYKGVIGAVRFMAAVGLDSD